MGVDLSVLWPGAPAYCSLRYNENPLLPLQYTWICDSIPPAGWPWETVSLGPLKIGPEGVLYRFSYSDLETRYAFGEALVGAQKLALGKVYWNAPPLDPAIATYSWTLLPKEKPMTIEVLRGTIHAKVGTLEETANVLHYIPDPEVPITPEIVTTFGDKLAAKVADFYAADTFISPGNLPVIQYMSRDITFDEVRAAHVQIVGTTVKWAPGAQTYYAPLTFGGGGGDALPAQIACTVTLHSGVRVGKRGRSGRGRVYFGPMAQQSINKNTGVFIDGFPVNLATIFKTHLVTAMDTAPDPFKLVILSPASNARYLVTDVLCGQVPDTQRRRRKSLLENYVTAT